MSGQPISLLRLGYPEIDTGLFTDDDFMMYNNVSTEFQEFIEGPYSVVLKYTGLRWLGESDGYISIGVYIFPYSFKTLVVSFPTYYIGTGDLMPPGKYYYSSTTSDAPEEVSISFFICKNSWSTIALIELNFLHQL